LFYVVEEFYAILNVCFLGDVFAVAKDISLTGSVEGRSAFLKLQ